MEEETETGTMDLQFAGTDTGTVDPMVAAAIRKNKETGEVDLAGLNFEQRLAVLSERDKSLKPITKEEEEEEEKKGGLLPEGLDLLSLEFWKLCWEDLRSLTWPNRQTVFETFLISQAAFFFCIILVAIFDAFVEGAVRGLLTTESFSSAFLKHLHLN